jgi:two-component system chemotaxis sensor kinase CheA
VFSEDEEILQDFLVEAGEILEQLSEQLVDLEGQPDNAELLNAIFRGFHTVKGGAGFLQLHALVDCCHITENLFDILRTGQRRVTSELMDVVLQVLDTVNIMFEQLKQRQEISPADPQLLLTLGRLVDGTDSAGNIATTNPVASKPFPDDMQSVVKTDNAVAGMPDIDNADAEFEQFLDALTQSSPQQEDIFQQPSKNLAAGASDEITDDEFEKLLDQIHGKGNHRDNLGDSSRLENKASGSDDISDEEFEALLNELHGDGLPGDVQPNEFPDTTVELDDLNTSGAAADDIDDNEFEALLDQLHGKDKGPSGAGVEIGGVAELQEEPSVNVVSAPKEPSVVSSAVRSTKENTAETTVRVDTQRLDDIMNMVGELVLVRNRLVRLATKNGEEVMTKAVSNLDVVTADLQSAVMKTRMQPIKKVFGRFPRVVRDLARSLNKEISLELQGEETDLDKNLVEALADPLVHLVRNSVDHGIEMPDIREAAGKPRAGKVILSAEQEGDHILLSIIDDGAGMDPDILRNKAIEKGLFDADSAARLSESDCFNIIFMPGFSTKTEISDVSGRGVGMDVVKTKIIQLNGSVDIHSQIGEGTRLSIKVPLTLAIMPTLMVMLADQTFALPLASVNEIFEMDLTRKNVVDGQDVITVRDKVLPLFYLKQWLVKDVSDDRESDDAHVVIVTVGSRRVGFVVDQLVGQEEVVIKPLGKMLQGTPGVAGATITGDGRIALILDVPGLLKKYCG